MNPSDKIPKLPRKLVHAAVNTTDPIVITVRNKLDALEEAYMLNSAVHIGFRLKLFNAIVACSNEENHCTIEEIALEADCKPRYVKEWLGVMTAACFVEVDEKDKFWIKAENVEALTTRESLITPSVYLRETGIFAKLMYVMRSGGPPGLRIADFNLPKKLTSPLDHMRQATDISTIVGSYLDDELFERFKKGGMKVLELGCGCGAHLAVFATVYQHNDYIGVDNDSSCIDICYRRMRTEHEGFTNLDFYCMDATDMPKDWNDRFDIVFVHFSCHDMSRPDKCFTECHRMLKKGGVLIMVDAACENTMHENKRRFGEDGILPYSVSLFQCLPMSKYNSLGLGAMCSKDTFLKLISAAGFGSVTVRSFERLPPTTKLYTCYKP